MTSSPPAAGSSGAPHRRSLDRRAVAIAGAAGAVGMACLVATLVLGEEPRRSVSIAWWLLAGACVATELVSIQTRFAGDRYRLRLIEIPAVLGAILATLPALLAARVAATLAAFVVRRPRPAEAAVIATTDLAGFGVFVGSFAVLGGGHASDLRTLAAAVVAVGLAAVFVTGALVLALRQPRPAEAVRRRAELAVVNALVGALGAAALQANPAAAWLLVAAVAMLVAGYRSHARLRSKHDDLGLLYDFTKRTGRALSIDTAMRDLLGQLRAVLRVDRAEIVVRPARDGAPLVRTILAGDGDVQVLASPEDALWQRIVGLGGPLLAAAPVKDDALRADLDERGIKDALVAPLRRNDGSQIGMLLVGDRLGDRGTFSAEDLPLFEALANHASVSLENRHLFDRLRMEAADKEHQSLHDALTGLPNRTLFQQRVDDAIAVHGSGISAAVLLLDLDRFKEINDTLGHHTGDLLLRDIGSRLRRALRQGDTVARLGGDEFGVLLIDLGDREAAVAAARGITTTFDRPFVIGGLTLEVGASVGVALWPDHGGDTVTLLQRADVAMYAAKSSHSGVALYDPGADTYSRERLSLVGELRQAIDAEQLAVHYQPKADATTGVVTGFEALVRWEHPHQGPIAPEEIVRIAEQTGLIRPLTQWVLSQALDQCGRWRQGGADLGVAVNLSARSMLDNDLPNDVQALLDDLGLPASVLTLEITESSILVDPVRASGILRRLHAMGVAIAIDDFGTGYSSFGQLRQLPVDEIKIDRSFVTTMLFEDSDAVIVRSIVDLGRNLGLRTVAEGVEDERTWQALVDLGCDVVQGYVLSRPAPAGDLDGWLAEHPERRSVAAPATAGRVVPFRSQATRPR